MKLELNIEDNDILILVLTVLIGLGGLSLVAIYQCIVLAHRALMAPQSPGRVPATVTKTENLYGIDNWKYDKILTNRHRQGK